MPAKPMLVVAVQILLAMVVGFVTSYQPGINARFAAACESRIYGGVVNFGVGFVAVVLAVLLTAAPPPTRDKLAELPWWAWTGGLLGAFFVVMAVFLIRPMGAANYFAAMIAGQFIGSMLIDHFGHMGLKTHPFSFGRAVGLLLMAAGVACIRLL